MITVMMSKFSASMISLNKSLSSKRNLQQCSGAVAAVLDSSAFPGALIHATLGLISAKNVEISFGRRILASVEVMKCLNGIMCSMLEHYHR